MAASLPFMRTIHRRMVVVATTVLVLMVAAMGVTVVRDLTRALGPELEQRAALLGRTISADFARALSFGIPFDRLVGVEDYLAAVSQEFPEVAYVAVGDHAGAVHYRFDAPATGSRPAASLVRNADAASSRIHEHSFALQQGEERLGTVRIGVDRRFLQRQLDDVSYDLAAVAIVAVFFTFELMLALLLLYAIAPMQRMTALLDAQASGSFGWRATATGRDALARLTRELSARAEALHRRAVALHARSGESEIVRNLAVRHALPLDRGLGVVRVPAALQDVRIPLFVLTFAGEMQKSFLPLYVGELRRPWPWMEESVAAGLPIFGWLVALIVFLPIASRWLERTDPKSLFLLSLAPSLAGFAGAALAQGVLDLALWRALAGGGYAMAIVAAQGYLLAGAGRGGEGRAIAAFVAVVMSATMCGTAIGGILANHLGFRGTFAVAAVLVLACAILAAATLSAKPGTGGAVPTAPALREVMREGRRMVRQRDLATLLGFILLPSSIVVAGVLWYLVPLHVEQLGGTSAAIARILMLYYIAIALCTPPAAAWVERRPWVARRMVVGGSIMAGGALAVATLAEANWLLGCIVALAGVGHSVARAPQVTLAMKSADIAPSPTGRVVVLDLLRLVERLGMAIGMVICALLLSRLGPASSIAAVGAVTIGGAILFLATPRRSTPT